ncbi:MAG: PEGA domain-containing protein [Treponema sp.]|nr:PEGA domain-containing protein [Treponema sp.]
MRNLRRFLCLFISGIICSSFIFADPFIIVDDDNKGRKGKKDTNSYYGTDYYSEEELDNERDTCIIIKTNVSNAEVYINGNYQGYTKLTLKNLRPGRYKLKLCKEYYCDISTWIEVRAGVAITYEFSLTPIEGTIRLKNIPSDAYVYIDDSEVSNYSKFNMIMGEHTLKIRRFNYEDIDEDFYLPGYGTVEIDPEFIPCSFSAWGFTIDKYTINPDYYGAVGRTGISFSVSATGSAELYISPQGHDENVIYYKFPTFTYWNQSYEWDGKDHEGNDLPDGDYDVIIYLTDTEDNTYFFEDTITINHRLVFPLLSATLSGLGAGHLPAIDPNGMRQYMVSLQGGPSFLNITSKGNSEFDRVDCALSFHGVPFENFEFGVNFLYFQKKDDRHGSFLSTDAKVFDSIKIKDKTYFSYGATFHWGGLLGFSEKFSSLDTAKIFPGVDNGCGLGLGGMAGFSSDWYSLTASGQYRAFCYTGSLKENANLLEAGLVISMKPVNVFSINLYGSYNFSFGNKSAFLISSSGSYALSVVSYGGEMNLLTGRGMVMLTVGFGADTCLDFSKTNSKAKVGISLIF